LAFWLVAAGRVLPQWAVMLGKAIRSTSKLFRILRIKLGRLARSKQAAQIIQAWTQLKRVR
jgi:hypothetical protein